MNLPNKLTILRTVMIPFFLVALYCQEQIPYGKWVALFLFVGASFTDYLDGYLARKWNIITNFGKFMDPLADKLLVCSALIAFVDLGRLQGWVVICIIAREFIISGFRLVASDNGVVIAASFYGKFKTVAQMILTILLIADLGKEIALFHFLEVAFIYISLILTIVSLVDYVYKNRTVMSEGNERK